MEKSGSHFDRQLMMFAQNRGLWIGGDWRTRTLEVWLLSTRIPNSQAEGPQTGGKGRWAVRGSTRAGGVSKHDAKIVEHIALFNERRIAKGEKRVPSKQIASFLSEGDYPHIPLRPGKIDYRMLENANQASVPDRPHYWSRRNRQQFLVIFLALN